MLNRFPVVLCISIMFAANCHAAIYKWVDDEGKVHYTETRPPQYEAEKMRVPTRAPENTSTYKRPTLKTNKDAKSEDGNGEQSEASQKTAEPDIPEDQKAQMCQRARDTLQTLNSSGRVRQRDDEGNITYLSEEEKQARISREKDRISKYCK